MRILIVFGTRPELIKLAPVIKELGKYPKDFRCCICLTAQHRQMIGPLLKLFAIKPTYDLNIMQEDQTLEYITLAVFNKLRMIFDKEKPDYLLVQGDTTTAMAASLLAFSRQIKIAHLEAGLRTYDKLQPYPEEVNRKIIDGAADLYFVHTGKAKENLLREGIKKEKIEVTGNPVVDSLLTMKKQNFNFQKTILSKIPFGKKRIILVTAHRRENFGQPLINICQAIKEIVRRYPNVYFVFPVHFNPHVQKIVNSNLKGRENIFLTKPLDYQLFVHLLGKSYLVLTDSGGIQEEAPSLGKPVLLLREVTERPEAVKAGAVAVVGTETKKIIRVVKRLLEDKGKYQRMAKAKNPYGDGKAGQRIVHRFLRGLR